MFSMDIFKAVIFLLPFVLNLEWTFAERSFKIDYDHDQFLKDGAPYRYVSGSIHYFRVPRIYWKDRMLKLKAAGLNAIQTYIAWHLHQPTPQETYDFTDNLNVTEFIQLAQSLELDVILRPGPYICAETDNGGLPWWLFKNPGIKVRSSDPVYMKYVTTWFNVILPMIKPLLYQNDGPIITVQVENEYGLCNVCDRKYMELLRDLLFQHFGDDAVLFTVDPPGANHKCSLIDHVYPTVDFGPSSPGEVNKWFATQRSLAPKGPLVNTEYYPAWFCAWGWKWPTQDPKITVDMMSTMYRMNASFNFYMFHGGSNFGHIAAGQSDGNGFTAVTTSYDYDAPISEAGDVTEKLHAIRAVMPTLTGRPITMPVPPDEPKFAFGSFKVNNSGLLSESFSKQKAAADSPYPLTFEDLNSPYGFVMYQSNLPIDCTEINIPGIADIGTVILDGIIIGVVRKQSNTTLKGNFTSGQELQIIVDSLGRTTGASGDLKGIVSNVTVDRKHVVTNWQMYVLKPADFPNAISSEHDDSTIRHLPKLPALKNIRKNRQLLQKLNNGMSPLFMPTTFIGSVPIETIGDTFFDSTGWGRGYLYINDQLIGRYWPLAGPVMTLYIPKSVLRSVNKVQLLEFEKSNCDASGENCTAAFSDCVIIRS